MNDDVRAVLEGRRRWAVVRANAVDGLRELPDGCVQCCVCSPPYWNLRRYECGDVAWGGDLEHVHVWGDEVRVHTGGMQTVGGEMTTEGRTSYEARNEARSVGRGRFCACGAWLGQLGQEPTPKLYVEHLVGIFREVRRTLADDGTLWIVIGDGWAANRSYQVPDGKWTDVGNSAGSTVPEGMKPKDLVGAPWALSFALRDDGWWLRDEVIWRKPAPMPYPATDRTVRAHEQVFLLSKAVRYFYDWEAISEPSVRSSSGNVERKHGADADRPGSHLGRSIPWSGDTRRARSVWTIGPEGTDEQHYASYPTALPARCIAAGSRPGDVVLDPFAGISRTGRAALLAGRRYVGVELSAEYAEASVRTCEAAEAEVLEKGVQARAARVRRGDVAADEAEKMEQIGLLLDGDEE